MLKVVDRAEQIKTSEQEVIELLETALERVKNGDLKGRNRCFIILVDDDLEKFEICHLFEGRATSMLAYLEVAKVALMQEMELL